MAAELVASKMAEAVLSQAVQRITDLLIEEADSLSGVRDDVESLRTELTRIKCFLEDAKHKQEQDSRVRNWVAEVRDLACEIEDVIETFVYKIHFSYFESFHLRKLRAQINSIKAKLSSIGEARQRYQIEFTTGSSSMNEGTRDRRRSYSDSDSDEDVVALTQTATDLKVLLLTEEAEEEEVDRHRVVSIVGTGGLGKTTLAKKVYNDRDVKKHFDCLAWAFVSQRFVARQVLEEILMQVGFSSHGEGTGGFERKGKLSKEFLEERRYNKEVLKGLEDRELVDLMKDELKEKRYLVVLDDIWRNEAWHSVRSAFPKGKRGSKILFTTRNEALASSADPRGPTIKPPLLTTAESLELLKRKTFRRESFDCSVEFEELGKEMATKCGGLPLAIVVLGGLLRTKHHSLDEWRKVLKKAKSRMINNLRSEQQYRVQDILELSFQDLPSCLKPCFLYMGRFPEDGDINKQNLIRLWIVEGFVPTVDEENREEGTLIEDIGEQYLDELISRCMVHVSRKDHTGKGIQSCRLHDLMRDFCISKAKEEMFLDSIHLNGLNNQYIESTKTRSRRLSIRGDGDDHCLGFDALLSEKVHPHLRSLLCSAPISSLSEKSFFLLRVLELDFRPGRQVTKLPKGTGDLIHLRYLKVSGVRGRLKLPESVGSLRNLQTLDVRGNWAVTLPGTMSRLKRLRHLLLPYSYSLPCWAIGAPFREDSLREAVTLKCVRAEHLITRGNIVLRLSNIRDLGVRYFRSDNEVSLFLKSLCSQIRSLRIHLSKGEFPEMETLSSCDVLTWLCLHGTLPASSLSSCLPRSLAKLELLGCSLNRDKMAIIEKHPNLRALRIAYDYSLGEAGDKFICSGEGFPNLEILTLDRLHGLEEWEVEGGSMPNLKKLDIQYIPRLRAIPEGLKYVITLRELNVSWMSREFMNRIRKSKFGFEGKDYYKVCHIPSISLSSTRRW